MKLFTKEIDTKLFKQYPLGNQLEKQQVVGKIFNPYGRGKWYLVNSDPSDPDYLWAIVQMGDIVEIGSVSRRELESLRVPPFRLPLERDLGFRPMNAYELWKGLKQGKIYKHGGMTEASENKQMLLNKAEELEHHVEEFEEAVKKADHTPPWTVAKITRAATDISDTAHYYDSENETKRESKEGEEMADGGNLNDGSGWQKMIDKIRNYKGNYIVMVHTGTADEDDTGWITENIEKVNVYAESDVDAKEKALKIVKEKYKGKKIKPKVTSITNDNPLIPKMNFSYDSGGSISSGNMYDDESIIKPEKPIDSMMKLELKRFVEKINPNINFHPKTTEGGRVQAKDIYRKYLEKVKNKMSSGGEMATGGVLNFKYQIGDEGMLNGSETKIIGIDRNTYRVRFLDEYGEELGEEHNVSKSYLESRFTLFPKMEGGGEMAKGGTLTVKVGDKVSKKGKIGKGVSYGVEGEVYETYGRFFKLKDKYGNKSDKLYDINDFKAKDIKSMQDGGEMAAGGRVLSDVDMYVEIYGYYPESVMQLRGDGLGASIVKNIQDKFELNGADAKKAEEMGYEFDYDKEGWVLKEDDDDYGDGGEMARGGMVGDEIIFESGYIGDTKIKHKGKILNDKGSFFEVEVENDPFIFDGKKGTTEVDKKFVIKINNSSSGKMADGGEIKDSDYLAVEEKDDMWYIISMPTTKEMAQALIDAGVHKGYKGKVVTVGEAKAHKHVLGLQYLVKKADGGEMAKGRIVKYGTTSKPDEDGFFYIINVQTNEKVKSKDIPTDTGYGKIENKFIGTRKKYGNQLRLQDAIFIAMKMNQKDNEMAKGGATFDEKVSSVKKSLIERKYVAPKVQKDYGKTYSPKEAEQSAKRIVGSMVRNEKRERLTDKLKNIFTSKKKKKK